MPQFTINLDATLFCGQSFAWSKTGDTFHAVLDGRSVSFTEETFSLIVQDDAYLRNYFDLDWDYPKALACLGGKDAHLNEAINSFGELHILNQNSWEVLVSFILSQNNNIKRIEKMYQALSERYGRKIGQELYTFPTAQEMAGATEVELRSLGMGFRAPYLISALEHAHLLDIAGNLDYQGAKELLMRIRGVGNKVADCILIFAFHHMEAFPLDTWMLKVMKHWYPHKDGSYFAPYAALAQQYLFHYARKEGAFT